MATLIAKKAKTARNGKARVLTPRLRRASTGNQQFAPDATLADVQERLGGIPVSRIHLHPQPGTATIRDLERLDGKTLGTCELIDGVIVEKQMGWYESLVASVLIQILGQHVHIHRLGIVLGSDGVLRLFPQQARAPDVCFVSKRRLHQYKPSRSKPIPVLIPDLAVEVLSKSKTPKEIELKLNQYFTSGVRLAWVIDPKHRSAVIHSSLTRRSTIELDGVLDGGKVVPGFRITLRELFDRADQMLEDVDEE
ncbi:MAG TPA: Uma2 family endonuclease [Planctomycetaceae bacterium]|nr:Uma2 family endonuclease [Planctomycetaceae bacterium]